MFKGTPSPYDELVAKTTDENQTDENWELILNICDKVTDEGEAGARNVIAALLKRLSHRNPNVQLYSLALAEALSKNCGTHVHHEIASKSFTQLLERIVTDRTTHDKVKRKTLSMILLWTTEFQNDTTLGIMEECHDNLRAKGYRFEEEREPPPPQVDDEIRRKEEEELQLVLEMSMRDKGGRSTWDSHNSQKANSNGAGPSNGSQNAGSSRGENTSVAGSSSQPKNDYGYAKSSGGYVAARTPSPQNSRSASDTMAPRTHTDRKSSATSSTSSQVLTRPSQTSLRSTVVSRVRALHTFEGTEQGELSFERGNIIKVVDCNYKDWWRGQLKGRTGIFPVNYVELLPDPTPEEIAREAELEAAVFTEAANIDRLLNMLRGLDPVKDNLADNEEIQELYRSSMSLRPKIVKLIDKYSQKRAELVTMNESFVKARSMFDRMMEESLARHSGLYQNPDYQPGPFGPTYEQGYMGMPQTAPAYPAASTPTPAPQAYGSANIYAGQQPPYPQGYATQQGAMSSPYGPISAQDATGQYPHYGAYAQPPTVSQAQAQSFAQPQRQQSWPQTRSPGAIGPGTLAHQDSLPEPGSFSQAQAQAPPQVQAQAQPQPQCQEQQPPQQNQMQGYPTPESHVQTQRSQPAQHRHITEAEGPPYVYDPNATYADPNVQAWAAYYAQGGTDKTGAVYFTGVPGLTDGQYMAESPPQGVAHIQQYAVQQEGVEIQPGASAAPSAVPVPLDGIGNTVSPI